MPAASHKMTGTKIYWTWRNMLNRCKDKKRYRYDRYGGRGIQVYELWRNDFQAFYDYVSKLPHYLEDGYWFDRIDNNGHYEPGNVRWATISTQIHNQSMKINNTSGHRGVCRLKDCNRWMAYIGYEGKRHYLGIYENIDEAIEVRRQAEIEFYGEASF